MCQKIKSIFDQFINIRVRKQKNFRTFSVFFFQISFIFCFFQNPFLAAYWYIAVLLILYRRLWKYIYFWQSLLALKKWKTTEIWKNENALSLKIFLFTLPDVDDLIKDTFYFLTQPNTSVCLSITLSLFYSLGRFPHHCPYRNVYMVYHMPALRICPSARGLDHHVSDPDSRTDGQTDRRTHSTSPRFASTGLKVLPNSRPHPPLPLPLLETFLSS